MTTSQADFLVKVAGIDGYFATRTGGDTSATTTDVYEGGIRTPTKLAGKPVTANITVDRPYDAQTQQATVVFLEQNIGSWRTTISQQAVDGDEQPIGDPIVYADALLVKVNPPDYDASSAKESRWGLDFAVRSPAV